jgi:hypothetical protein
MGKSNFLKTAIAAGALAVVVGVPTVASATIIPLATEVMMEDTAVNNLIVGSLFDPTPGSSLSYNTTMSGDGSYTYSTVAGSKLDGVPISLSGTGTESSPSPGSYQWITTEDGDYDGSPDWSVADVETATQDPATGIWTIVSVYNWYDEEGNLVGDLNITVYVNKDLTVDIDTGYFTDALGNKVPMSDFVSRSAYNDDTGDWDVEVLPVYPPSRPEPYPIVSAGSSPFTGGAGTFTTTFVVPEPSTWVMMALGFVGLGYAGYRRAGKVSVVAGA